MPIELIAIAVGAVLLLVLINYTQKRTVGLDRAYFNKKWQEIRTLQKTSAAAARLSVIEADKLLDKALKDLGMAGETMGDRMKSAGKLMGNEDGIWQAHRLRNRLVHEDIHPKRATVRTALKAYESTLKKLGAL